jgi:hypothetical protein
MLFMFRIRIGVSGWRKRFSFCVLGKGELVKLKLRAVRCGVWFKALRRIDRALIDLTIKVADAVRSFALAEALFSVMERLGDALENRFLQTVKEVGFPLARRLSLVAQGWGNNSASSWASDVSFARFLAVVYINGSGVFKP